MKLNCIWFTSVITWKIVRIVRDSGQFEEHIIEKIEFFGDLSKDQKEKLFKIAHLCPIAKILQQGIKIQEKLIQD